MELTHMQRLSVIFEYFKKEVNGNVNKFALLSGISKRLVLDSFKRENKYINMHDRFFICVNLELSGFIWDENFLSEEHMLKSIIFKI